MEIYGIFCLTERPYGGYCDSVEECTTANGICKDKVCTCEETNYVKENKCLPSKYSLSLCISSSSSVILN